jgi:5-methylcytosine-specific restriction protein A
MDKQKNPRTRLLWKTDLSNKIKNNFPETFESFASGKDNLIQPLMMKFEAISVENQSFEVTIYSTIDEDLLARDIESELIENEEPRKEGAIKQYFGKRYERDSLNRKKAIKIHGLKCTVCKFDFEKVYGLRGKDFIEVHHTKPLFTLEGQVVAINPETDLVPVCSNCHRMIHRRHDNVLTIEQLKQILKSNEE